MKFFLSKLKLDTYKYNKEFSNFYVGDLLRIHAFCWILWLKAGALIFSVFYTTDRLKFKKIWQLPIGFTLMLYIYFSINMNNMSKDKEKKIVGQSIFKQIIDILPKKKFDSLVQKHKTDNVSSI